MVHRISFSSAMILILFSFIFLGSCASRIPGGNKTQLDSLMELRPVPGLNPREVVGIQLAAFKANDTDDKGIAVAYRFTSPKNREYTGTFDKFALLVKQKKYSPMLDNTGFEIGPEEIQENTAIVAARVDNTDGSTTNFLFVLTRQRSGFYSGSWMTDGVLRVDSGTAAAVPAPITIDS